MIKNNPIPPTVADLFYIKEGTLYNKIDRGTRAKKDQPAGNTNGYLKIRINGVSYYAHRIAWFLYYNEQPPNTIDHIDGDKTNNKKENLRECTQQENTYNISKTRASSGVKGVTIHNNKYRVRLRVNGKVTCFGVYNTLEEAESVAREKRELYHREFTNHGT